VVTGAFAGPTAGYYRRFRRDLPAAVLDQLTAAVGLTPGDRVLDLGVGTGQVAVPLAARVATVIAVDREPDMLTQLRRRLADEAVTNVVCVLACDRDLPAVTDAVGAGTVAAVTVANALHDMDAAVVFDACTRLLSPDGTVAVITHGRPLWLLDTPWARAVREYLQTWAGRLQSTCGTDRDALDERRQQLIAAGFTRVELLEHSYRAPVDAGYVLGHLASAMPADLIPADRHRVFDDGLRAVLRPYEAAGDLVEDVPVTILTGRR